MRKADEEEVKFWNGISIGGKPAAGATGGGGLSLPYTYTPDADGALPSVWKGSSTMTISGGQIVNAPTLGSELLTNGNMETGDPPTGWTAANSTLDGVADERTGGAGAQSLSIARNGGSPSAYRYPIAFTVGDWFKYVAWLKNIDASSGAVYFIGGTDIPNNLTQAGLTWVRYQRTGTALSTGNYAVSVGAIAAVDGQSSRADDASLKEYTTPAQLTKSVNAKNALVRVGANITIDQFADALGVDCCVDDPINPQNLVRAIFSRWKDTVRLVKIVNGTPSVVFTEVAVTYVAGKALEIRHTATNTFQVWYNDLQVSTDKTISDASIVANTYQGVFISDVEDAGGVDAFFCSAI